MENIRLSQVLAEHQMTIMEQVIAIQVQANTRLWEQVTSSLAAKVTDGAKTETLASQGACPMQPVVQVQKITPNDDPEWF